MLFLKGAVVIVVVIVVWAIKLHWRNSRRLPGSGSSSTLNLNLNR